jgi:hypothetical protein
MNITKTLIAASAIALLGTGAAFAQEATSDAWMQSVHSSKTRAEVSVELAAARQSGLTKAWSAGYMEPVRHSALRAEVRAQTLQAIASGEQQSINAMVYGNGPAAPLQLSQAAN